MAVLIFSLTPAGAVHVSASTPDVDGAGEVVDDAARRIVRAFAEGTGPGLLQLGASELQTQLPAAGAWLREIGHRFMAALCTVPELEEVRDAARLASPRGDLEAWVAAAPPLLGGEYLGTEIAISLWEQIGDAFRSEVRSHDGTASETSTLAKELVESGDVFHPVAWTPREAHRFLKEVPALESAGVIVRVPEWWNARRPPRPAVTVTVGSKRPGGIGAEALLDFDVALSLDGEPLTPADRRTLERATDGLALIASGSVTSVVQGSRPSPYQISIGIRPLAKACWTGVVKACSGHIGSLVELLRGGLNDHVMRIVTEPECGLFPSPAEISLECSCPDWATMCKHVAASLYGVGARLDERPALLFTLRGVDPAELVASAAAGGTLDARGAPRSRGLASANLSELFGVEIDEAPVTTRIQRPRQDAPTVEPRSLPRKMANRRRTPAPEPERPVSRLLLEFVRAEPGRRMEQVAVALGLTTRDLAFDAKRLLATGHIRRVGEKRATRYYPGVQATGNVEAKTRRRSRREPSRSQGERT